LRFFFELAKLININLFLDKHIHKNRREEFVVEIKPSVSIDKCALAVL